MVESNTLKHEAIRRELHAHPELSGAEYETQKRILNYLDPLPHFEIMRIAETGVLAVQEGEREGPTVLIRADIDALPINEPNEFDHRSKTDGVSHKCGHDGHTTIVLALAEHLSKNPIAKGKVILLFQPAEEDGTGAARILSDDYFYSLNIDWVFALHNLPGSALNTVVVKENEFTAEVKSAVIKLDGVTSHAGEPDKGKNPAKAIADILFFAENNTSHNIESNQFLQITPVHVLMGQKAYGISPGSGEVHLTLRSWYPEVLRNSCKQLENFVESTCERDGLNLELYYTEAFAANINDGKAVEMIRKASHKLGLEVKEADEAFRWGEDFGLFTQRYRGAMFGIGAGENTPVLHHPYYDFPDAIIPTAKMIFSTIIDDILR
jgi:amidohydrolase